MIKHLFSKKFSFPGLTVDTERQFHNILLREQKRSERSRNPVMLLLLDISELVNEGWISQKRHIKQLSAAINQSTRDIDIKGWHKDQEVLGIIYTDVQDNVVSSILNKVFNNLSSQLGKENFKKINKQCITFPDFDTAHHEADIRKSLSINKSKERKTSPLQKEHLI